MSKHQENAHYAQLTNTDQEAGSQVRSKLLFSSAMLSDQITMQSETPFNSSYQATTVPLSSDATTTDRQRIIDTDASSDEATMADISSPESMSDRPDLQNQGAVSALNKIPKSGAVSAKPGKTLANLESLTNAARHVASDLLEVTNIKKLKQVVHVVADITEVTNVNLKHAATLVADFIPVVGNSRLMFPASRVRRARRAMEAVDADELNNHPLHRECALSASIFHDSSARNIIMGGDLASIKRLVEEDPSRLHLQLPTSGDTPLSIAIKFGAMQWLQLQDYPNGTSNLPVVEYLIQADIDYLRTQAVLERQRSGNSSPISLASLVLNSAVYKRDCEKELPLHNAIGEGYGGAARALLNVDKDVDYNTILQKPLEGDLPLHMAVRGDDLELVKLLLDADKCREAIQLRTRQCTMSGSGTYPKESTRLPSLTTRNAAGEIPLHVSLSSVHRFEMWALLLDADETKETLHIQNHEGATAFKFFVDRPDMFANEEGFVDAHLADAILDRLLSGKRLEPWDNHLKRSVAKSPRMQTAVNDASANRLPVMIFIADFYSHIASAAILYEGTASYIADDKNAFWMGDVLFAMIVYFSIRTLVQLFLTRRLFWANFWNYLDLVRICLLFVLALAVNGIYGKSHDADDWDDYVFRRLLLALSVFIYLGIISFFRITYKPVALFVGGTAKIITTLIPFMVTFIVILAFFAYGYWVGGYVSLYAVGGKQSYLWWFYEVFLSVFNGTDDLATMEMAYINKEAWTVCFILLVQILLLNVLIAVITSAWQDATEKSLVVFWKYRLEYVSGVLPIEYFIRRYFGSTHTYWAFAKLADFIDSLDKKSVRDHVNWDVYPYNLVIQQPSLYWDSESFLRVVSEDIKKKQMRQVSSPELPINLRSLHSKFPPGMRNLQEGNSLRQWYQMQSFDADLRFSSTAFKSMCTRLRMARFFLVYGLAFVAGFVTFGFSWPRRVRLLVCAGAVVGDTAEITDVEGKDRSSEGSLGEGASTGLAAPDRFDALEKKVDEIKEAVEALRRTVDQLVKLQSTPPGPPDGDG